MIHYFHCHFFFYSGLLFSPLEMLPLAIFLDAIPSSLFTDISLSIFSGSFPYFSSLRKVRAGAQMTGTKTEAMEECCWLAYSHCLLFYVFFQHQDHQLRCRNSYSDLGSPTSTIKQENTPQVCPQANLVGEFSQLKFPPLKYDASLYGVDIKLARAQDF